MTSPLRVPLDPARKRRRFVALVVILVASGAAIFFALRQGHRANDARADGDAPTTRPARIVPDSVRIKVEVINATATRGLGRLATAWLRDQGFDVVAVATAPEAERRDSTLVLVRSGHAEWGALAAKAIGGARVEARPDSLRYLDLTVLVGRAWRAPPQSLYP